jgi:hypothetical protein
MIKFFFLGLVINTVFIVYSQADSIAITNRINKVREYRNTINLSFEKFYQKDYESVLVFYSKLDLSLSFIEDLDVFTRSIDSLSKIGREGSFDEIRSEISDLKKRTWNNKYLAFNNELVNYGHFVVEESHLLDNATHYLDPKESLLISITVLDRFIDEMRRTTIHKEKVVNQLFEKAAQNALNILKNEQLPFRVIGSVWNDDLSLAIVHCIKSLEKKDCEILLDALKKHVLLGNIHPYQYAVFYDVFFGETFPSLSYYGTRFYQKNKKNNFQRELYCIHEFSSLNTRREEILLPSFEGWLYYQNLTYDCNCNRH